MSTKIIQDDLEALRAELERERLAAFDPMCLLALAVFPEWTDTLAEAVWFDAGGDAGSLADLLNRLDDAGLAQRREVLTEDGEVHEAFWLPAAKRADVGRHLHRTWSDVEILDQINELAGSLSAHNDTVPAVGPWLRVARHHMRSPSGVALMADIDNFLDFSSTTEALHLVAAAQALGEIIGEPLLSTARRAQWRIDRRYRESMDARGLAHYLPRQEVEQALLALIRGDVWAMHLLGEGGVGKTMTVRDLASGQFAERYGLERFPVARIDFDHLDPRYPDRRPAELLLALSAELTGYLASRSAYWSHRATVDEASAVHESLALHEALDLADQSLLDSAIDAFAESLDELGGPVLLVLDTCEELAKLYGPGGRAPAIDRTFGILERIRDRTSAMRVVLAGRRWLTPPPEPGRSAGLVLAPRPYLQIVHIGGFTQSQAAEYIDRRDPDRVLSERLRAALLTHGSRDGDDEINPFDLAGYCDWALDEPDLDVDRLQASDDPYVQQRIIARVPSSVRDCLPVAVELGRFDRAMIEPYLARRTIDPDRAFSGLVSQEWVSTVTFDPDGRPQVIEVDNQLLPRLRAAIEANATRFPLDRIQLGRDLAALVATSPVEDLAIESVEGALRLLPIAEAATMWARLEERITEADAWGWANQAIPRAAAVETERSRGGGPTILAHILATQAAAVLRQPGSPGMAGLWHEVTELALRHPDPALADALTFRGSCGTLTPDLPLRAVLPEHVWVGPMIAVIDRLAPDLPSAMAEIVDSLCAHPAPEISSTARLARAANRLAGRDAAGAADDVTAAVRAAESTSDRKWTDWVTPPRLADRTRLARLAIAVMLGERPDELPLESWRAAALDHLTDIDAERLVAETIAVELGWRLVDQAVLDEVMAAESYVPQRQPTHYWHRHATTLCAIVAMATASAGNAERAVQLLHQRQQAAVSAGEDPVTIDECDRALVAVCRMFRSTGLSTSIHRVAREGQFPHLREQAWAVLALVDGESPPDPEIAGGWRAWWQTQIKRPGHDLGRVIPPPGREASPPDPVADIDRAEFNRTTRGLLSRTGAIRLTKAKRAITEAGFADPEARRVGLGAVLRAHALLGWDERPISTLVGRTPPRVVARIALSEGELLALRLPEEATHLLRLARGQFFECGDLEAAHRANILLVLALVRAGTDPRSVRLGNPPRSWDSDADTGWVIRSQLAEQLVRGEPVPAPIGPSPECDVELADTPEPQGIFEPVRLASGSTQFSFAFDSSKRSWSGCAIGGSRVLSIRLRPLGEPVAPAQPYLVVPLFLPDEVLDDNWEQRLLSGIDKWLGGKSAVWMRCRTQRGGHLAADWRLEPVAGHGSGKHLSTQWDVLHLVGTPVRTKAGWRMRMAASLGQFTKTGRGTYAGEILLGPDDLPPWPTKLVVLQAEPVDGPPRPLGRLREGMCALARDFRALGLTVLVIPPLNYDDYDALSLPNMVEMPADVLELVYRISSAIAAQEMEPRPGADRPSLDVLLFV